MMKTIAVLSTFLFTGLIPASALAVLGEKASSTQTVKTELAAASQKMSVEVSTSANAKWNLQIIEADGVTVREFSDKDGTVFAVAWRGINRPDLSLLLGDYYQEFFAAEKAEPKTKSRAPSETKTSRVTVRRSGHMRDMRGLAYLPDKVPAGVLVQDLPR